jgi:hypothetical protein
MRTIEVPDGTQITVDGVVVAGPGPNPTPTPAPTPTPTPTPTPAPTPANVQVIPLPWPPAGVNMKRTFISGFGTQIIALKITRIDTSTAIKIGSFFTAEAPGALNTFREMTISSTPGNFTNPDLYDGRGSPDTGPGGQFTYNDPQFKSRGCLFNFSTAGQDVYVNLRNLYLQDGQTADMIADLHVAT